MRSLFPVLLAVGLCLTACDYLPGPPAPMPVQQATSQEYRPVPLQRHLPPEREKPLVIIFDLNSTSVDHEALSVLSQRLWVEMLRSGQFLMVSRDNVRRLLESRGIALTDPYRRPVSMQAIGQALEADYLIFGEVGQIGQSYTMDAQLLDVDNGRIIGVASTSVTGRIEQLVPMIPTVVRTLLSSFHPEPRFVTVPRPDGSQASTQTPRLESPPAPRQPDVEALTTVREEPEPAPTPAPAPEPTPPPTPTPAEVVAEQMAVPEPPVTEPTVTEPEVTEPEPQPEAMTEPEPPSSLIASNTVDAEGPAAPEPMPEPVVEETPAPMPEPAPMVEEPTPAPSGESALGDEIAQARHDMIDAIANARTQGSTTATDAAQAGRLVRQSRDFPQGTREKLELLEQALELNPRSPDILALIARERMAQEDFAGAEEDCLRALNLAPDNSVLFTVLGSIHHSQQDYAGAAAAMERALELDDANYFAQYNLGLALRNLDPARARPAFQRFIEMAADIPEQTEYIRRAQTYLSELGQ